MVEDELRDLGLPVIRQEIGDEVGSNGWNIYSYLEGDPGLEPLLFCLHLDTVAPCDNVRPVIEDGIIRSSGDTILGADGKAAIAAVLETLNQIIEQGRSHRPVELVFTICEEVMLLGARRIDYGKISSRQAIVMDHCRLGEIVYTSPSCVRATVEVTGQSAHAAMNPDAGVNALMAAVEALHNINAGKVDNDTIINVSNFVSLGKSNVVPDHARFDIEIRSFSDRLLKQHVGEMERVVTAACERHRARYSIDTRRFADRMCVPKDTEVISSLLKSMKKHGIEGELVRTFGVCDVLHLVEHGIDAINIGCGMMNLHGTNEYIAVADLERLVGILHDIL
jgi:tripeptide aminopeptidase